jgi:hypothetical protein
MILACEKERSMSKIEYNYQDYQDQEEAMDFEITHNEEMDFRHTLVVL